MFGATIRRGVIGVIGVAASGALLMTTFPTADAQAAAPTASSCTITGMTPHSAVIGAKDVKQATFSVHTKGCRVKAWTIDFGDGLVITRTNQQGVEWLAKPLTNANARSYPVPVTAIGTKSGEAATTAMVDFSLYRRSGWGATFRASPGSVTKGRKITLRATLKRVSWDLKKMPYSGYGKQPVQVQFKATGGKAYRTIRTVKTTSRGSLTTTVQAVRTGKWRLRYAGDSTTGHAASAAHVVKVG